MRTHEAANGGGARRFLREVGSIVLGVLIALAIGEIADAVRWRTRIARSQAAMRLEMAGNRFNLAERAALRPCVERRLAEIERLVGAAPTSAALPVVGAIGTLPERVSEHAAFDVAMSEGVLLHSDAGTARDIALAYDVTVTDFAEQADAERTAWTTLTLIEGAPRSIDGDTLLTLRQALAEARRRAAAIDETSARSDRLLHGAGVPIEFGPYRDPAGLLRATRALPLCRPLALGRP